jgi:NADH dehydrogenase FAD-containing subunit
MVHLQCKFIILFDQIYIDVVEGAAEKLCKNLEQHGILVMQESPVRSVETPNIPMNSSKKEKEKEKEKASHLIWFYVA